MLSLAKLRVGQEAYQLSGVAQSLDAYYTGAGEAPGVWVGGGAARLGLDGEVGPEDLRAVLAGMAPGSGGLSPNGTTIRPHRRRVPGFDATFKAPKSASVLHAVSDDPRVQGAVIDAGNHAVAEAVGYLEREAVRVQRGSHNTAWVERKRAELAAAGEDPAGVGPRRLATSGVIGAAFRHRTSRDSDPLLHWHVLIANLVEGADGKWSAFAHPDLYRHARAAGELFQAVFRAELSRTLGVEWRPGRHVAEIAGIPQGLLDRFSKRRAEIEAWLEATGTPADAAGRQAAVLATRRNKPEREGERLDAAWKQEAREFGWGPAEADQLAAQWRPRDPAGLGEVWRLAAVGFDEHGQREDYERVVTPHEWIANLLRSELTVYSTTFTDTDVVRAVAHRLGGGSTVDTLERLVNLVLASDHVLAVDSDDGREWYTSRELHQVEARYVDAVSGRGGGAGVDAGVVAEVIAGRPTLGADQAAAVTELCAADNRVSVLIGPAGTGKTYTLDTVRDAYERAGWRVLGAGPSARAAQELTAGAGIAARTLHSLLADIDRGLESFEARSLLVVDEAAMADIRTLAQVVTASTERGARVLLVGDQHQMPSIGAGGGFAYAAHHAPTVSTLTVNRRQREQWEQEALTALRNGSVAAAVAAYRKHDRVIVTADATSMIGDAIARWTAAIDAGLRPVMLAGTNELVDRLNRAAINVLTERGLLADDAGTYGGDRYRVGARVTLRRNSTRERTAGGDLVEVANGQLGTVVAVDGGQLTIRLDCRPDDDIVLDQRYLARGGQISHGYALTTQRAQGGTWDLSITVGADGLYREAAYTDLSRGITENYLIITDPDLQRLLAEADPDLDRHDTGIDPDEHLTVDEDLIDRLSKSRAKHLAHTLDPDHHLIDQLARTQPLAHLEQRLALARQAARIATQQVGADATQLTRQLDNAEHTARHAAVGVRVKPFDRHNVGTIIHVDDEQGTVDVHFISSDERREAQRRFPWQHVAILDRDTDPHPLTAAAVASLDRYRASVQPKIAQWNSTVTALGSYPGEVAHIERAIHRHIAIHAGRLAADQPAWLDQLIGPRPADPIGETTWHDLTTEIARWRSRHHIAGPGLGPAPADPHLRGQWQDLTGRVASTRRWLHTADRHEPSWPAVPSHRELVARRAQLETIFDTAPDDTRPIIHAVRAGQLALVDIDDILRDATTSRDARKRWVLEHWPHVVEYDEITTTLTQRRWGPDRRLLLGQLDDHDRGDALAAAIDADQPWLQAALCALDANDDTPLTHDQITWLNAVADHRHTHHITTRDPLGPIPTDPDQTADFDSLLLQLRDVRPLPEIEHQPEDLGIEI